MCVLLLLLCVCVWVFNDVFSQFPWPPHYSTQRHLDIWCGASQAGITPSVIRVYQFRQPAYSATGTSESNPFWPVLVPSWNWECVPPPQDLENVSISFCKTWNIFSQIVTKRDEFLFCCFSFVALFLFCYFVVLSQSSPKVTVVYLCLIRPVQN